MAHFNRIRSLGFWTLNSVLQPSEMEAFDANQSKAVNGDEGGTWAPSDPIIIGGDGVQITGAFTVTSAAQLQGGATVSGGDLTVSQDATIQGTLDVDGQATVDSLAVVNDASIQGNGTIQGTLDVTGDITTDNDVACERVAIHTAHLGSNILSVGGDARITGDTEINGAFACDGAASFGSTISIAGAVTPTGAGRVRKRYLALTDADTTIHANTCDVAQMGGSVMSASRTVVVTTTGAAAGDMMIISNDDITHSLYVRLNSLVGTLVSTLLNGSTRAVVMIFDGSTWRSLFQV